MSTCSRTNRVARQRPPAGRTAAPREPGDPQMHPTIRARSRQRWQHSATSTVPHRDRAATHDDPHRSAITPHRCLNAHPTPIATPSNARASGRIHSATPSPFRNHRAASDTATLAIHRRSANAPYRRVARPHRHTLARQSPSKNQNPVQSSGWRSHDQTYPGNRQQAAP